MKTKARSRKGLKCVADTANERCVRPTHEPGFGPDIALRKQAKVDLIVGAYIGDLRLVLSALRRGANANARFRGCTMLHWAVQEGHMNVVKALVRGGASLERRDSLGFTPLDQAVGGGNFELVNFLLRAGAKVNGRTRNGTPLHTACAYRRLRIAKLLLAHGANPSALDSEGRTPEAMTKFKSNRTDKALQKLLKESKTD